MLRSQNRAQCAVPSVRCSERIDLQATCFRAQSESQRAQWPATPAPGMCLCVLPHYVIFYVISLNFNVYVVPAQAVERGGAANEASIGESGRAVPRGAGALAGRAAPVSADAACHRPGHHVFPRELKHRSIDAQNASHKHSAFCSHTPLPACRRRSR